MTVAVQLAGALASLCQVNISLTRYPVKRDFHDVSLSKTLLLLVALSLLHLLKLPELLGVA